MENESLSFAIAFAAGFLSFASPCVLPLVPVYLSYLAGSAVGARGGTPSRSQLFVQALAFVLGFSLVFVSLGAVAGLIGVSLAPQLPLIRQVGGVILIIFGLHTAGVLRISLLLREWRPGVLPNASRFGPATSFVVGMVFAFGWTPCVGPVLGGILMLASTSETALQGAYLLGVYSLGMGIPFLVAGLLAGALMGVLKAVNRYLRVVEVVSGIMLVVLGFLVFSGELERLSGLFSTPL
jgi:cytochrome c-type biogenesis protein